MAKERTQLVRPTLPVDYPTFRMVPGQTACPRSGRAFLCQALKMRQDALKSLRSP